MSAFGTRLLHMPEQELEALAHQSGYRVDKVARSLGLTRRQFERVFKAQFATCPKRWMTSKRMELARGRLPTAESVKSVGYETGFRDPSHFCHDFKRFFGVVPSVCLPSRDLE
jgi:AraC-like DNA-binding protein